ncbi:UNVERIFIED_CONTAM: hypothetical protein Sradi_1552800 [Sesamum radiatum]|uniref:Uncharacterized protein n=1 Tax=Sesamum radiatum TaxID=300843 RepID=A0AAW2U850_SESRA
MARPPGAPAKRPPRRSVPNRGNTLGRAVRCPLSKKIMADELPLNWKDPDHQLRTGTRRKG